MSDITITFIGNATGDPELRYTANRRAILNVTLAHNPRRWNKETEKWENGTTLFQKVQIWGPEAENAAASITRGDRVVAVGHLEQEADYQKEGETRKGAVVLVADELAGSFKFATAQFAKAARGAGEETQF
ncbi:single-stranded DNA-binding protein [Mycobacteroides abscessus]|uniref:single-stranded DNA-binding protein n=1 Tax=Mycobacteroides abscessus TaxID=36809 RepID=UPI0009A833A4|nr:single-stranded DNA-binding protein [Mycobacteroides abscessus]SKQ73109.1 single-stranded DNA-binding protein [Mycobacteroides abscessus subsp. massiliense]